MSVLHTFTNEEDGVAVFVARVPQGYSVSLKDTDSGEFLPTIPIYPDQDTAIREARKAAHMPERPIVRNVKRSAVSVTGEVEGRPVQYSYALMTWQWADRRDGELNGCEGLENAVTSEYVEVIEEHLGVEAANRYLNDLLTANLDHSIA